MWMEKIHSLTIIYVVRDLPNNGYIVYAEIHIIRGLVQKMAKHFAFAVYLVSVDTLSNSIRQTIGDKFVECLVCSTWTAALN